MNIKKSIKLMKVIKEILPEHFNFDFGKEEIEEIVKRLQMWDDLESKYGTFFKDTEEGRCLSEMMAKMEYEYFPKSKKTTYWEDKFYELEEEFEETERELKREIEHWKTKYYNKGV